MYLKNFASNKMCYVLDMHGTVRQRSIKSICYEDDTYELTTVDGAVCNENTFEKMFGQLENIYEPFITELISTLDSNKSLKG